MATLKFSGVTNKLESLGDNDLVLVAAKNSEDNNYTTGTIAGSLLKGSTSGCNFSEEKLSTSLTNYEVAQKSDVEKISQISEDVNQILNRTIDEGTKESASYVMPHAASKYYLCNQSISASSSGVTKNVTIGSSDSNLTIRKDQLVYDVVLQVKVYNKLTDSYITIAYKSWDKTSYGDISFNFKAGTIVQFLATSSSISSGNVNVLTYDIYPYWYATDLKYISDAIVTISPQSYTVNNYDSDIKVGDVVTPTETVTYSDGTVLTKNTDYKVSYSNNTVGSIYPFIDYTQSHTSALVTSTQTAKITLTGKNDYSGVDYTTFKITKKWLGICITARAYYGGYVSLNIIWSCSKTILENAGYVLPYTITCTNQTTSTIDTNNSNQTFSWTGNFGTKTLKIVDANGTVIVEQQFTVSNPKS